MQIKIRELREYRDITQQKISDILGCDRSLYAKYERAERDIPLHLIAKLAIYYDTSIDYLTGLTNEKRPYKRK